MGLGDQRHRVVFEQPSGRVNSPDGGYTDTFTALPPGSWFVSIAPASPQDLERFTAGTVVSQATHLVRGRYHPGVTTASRMIATVNRAGAPTSVTFAIAGCRNVDERSITMELLAIETQ
jgi:head-tail adaptor